MSEHSRKGDLKGPLAMAVKTALQRYFEDLDGARPGDLYYMVVSQVEQPLLEFVMQHAGSNQCMAARILGINRNTLRKKLKLYGLD